METGPRVLLWNYTHDELLELDRFFETVSAPPAQVIEEDQGNLPVHEILFTDKKSDQPYSCNEKVMLFFNVPAQMIHTIMGEAKKWELPRPIYAVVTPQSIEWNFSDLVEHLVKERDFIRKRASEEKKKNTCPHSE